MKPSGSLIDTADLRKLLVAAAPRPWEQYRAAYINAADGTAVAQTQDEPSLRGLHAELIVAAINALPALLDRIEWLEALICDMRLNDLHADYGDEINALVQSLVDSA